MPFIGGLVANATTVLVPKAPASVAAFWGNASHIGATFADDPWDIVELGGDPLPGICEVKGLAQLELDKKKQKGTNGLTLTVTGYQPGPFEITCTVWTQEQWEFLLAWIQKFWIQPQLARAEFSEVNKRTSSTEDGKPIYKKVKVKNRAPQVALDVRHPALEAIGIMACTIQGISMPESTSAEGFKMVRIKVVEHKPSGKVTVVKTAKGSSSGNVATDDRIPELEEKNKTPEKPSKNMDGFDTDGPDDEPGGGVV